jgi:hypothetical protein
MSSGHDRSVEGLQWDSRAEYHVGVMIARYLADNPPPSDAALAGELATWSENLRRHGESRLRSWDVRPTADCG